MNIVFIYYLLGCYLFWKKLYNFPIVHTDISQQVSSISKVLESFCLNCWLFEAYITSCFQYIIILNRFERMLNEMISHLERQPRNKERRIAWLKSADSLFDGVGLVLLAHFRRIFPLFFQWMHADDNETIILVSTFISIETRHFKSLSY